MSYSPVRGERATVVETVVDELDAPYFVLNPSAATLLTLPQTPIADAAADSVVIAEPDALKTVRDDFKHATAMADLVEEGLTLVEQETDPEATVIVGDDGYFTMAATDDTVTALGTADGVDDFQAFGAGQADGGEAFSLRVPGLARIRETATETFDESFVDSLDAALDGVDEFPEANAVDGVTLLLALAARHEELLYDVSKWGEDIGIASKATFSRSKTNLEDNGLIDTEKVPIDVGRPRLRLLPGTGELDSVADEDLVEYLTDALV